MNLIVVFNTCGLGNAEQPLAYIGHLHSLLNQRGVNTRVVWSSCCNEPRHWDMLRAEFRNRIAYYLTGDVIPVNMSFNHATACALRSYPKADGVVYVDSGVHCGADHKALAKLAETHASGPYGMTAALTDEDDGFNLWFGEMNATKLFREGKFVMPVGMTMNLHFQIFDSQIIRAFGRPLPDVFASQCTESVFTFMCAAVGKRFVAHGEKVRHYTGMDGPSAGFQPIGPGWKHLLPQAKRTMEEIIADPEARACGFGYEECQQILMHDATLYDAEGNAREPQRLGKFIKDNLFLDDAVYEKINHIFIP